MIKTLQIDPDRSDSRWMRLAQRVLDGEPVDRSDALAMLRSDDAELLDLLAAAYRIRCRFFANQVQLYVLKNAKSGLCSEDCGYCSQAVNSTAPIDRYPLVDEEELLAGARQAAAAGARTYCIVGSGRGPTDREIDQLTRAVARIKRELGLHICCSLGLLTPEQAGKLKRAGVNRFNHNLNTSRRFYPRICTTHSYDDRLKTLRLARQAGLELCCGVIVGMGEEDEDVVDMAFELRSLKPESIPINFLHPIAGTQLEGVRRLNPRRCVKVLCLFRFVHPRTEIRIAGGREVNLRSLQPLGLYAANSIFISDYLTTKGQPAEQDFQMLEDLGFEIVVEGGESRTTAAEALRDAVQFVSGPAGAPPN
ncbi:MAG TPA: biotin synthase BioB [Planctomycetaceae bacterium]|nr:biotin synthase BioB [Planctomycetaceae bacterium]